MHVLKDSLILSGIRALTSSTRRASVWSSACLVEEVSLVFTFEGAWMIFSHFTSFVRKYYEGTEGTKVFHRVHTLWNVTRQCHSPECMTDPPVCNSRIKDGPACTGKQSEPSRIIIRFRRWAKSMLEALTWHQHARTTTPRASESVLKPDGYPSVDIGTS